MGGDHGSAAAALVPQLEQLVRTLRKRHGAHTWYVDEQTREEPEERAAGRTTACKGVVAPRTRPTQATATDGDHSADVGTDEPETVEKEK